jgi:hypothetical protein
LNKAKLKQSGKLFLLIVEDVKDMEALHRLLSRMSQSVKEKNSSLAG